MREIFLKYQQIWSTRYNELNYALIDPMRVINNEGKEIKQKFPGSTELNLRLQKGLDLIEKSKDEYYVSCRRFQDCFVEKKISEDISSYAKLTSHEVNLMNIQAKKTFNNMQNIKEVYLETIKDYNDNSKSLINQNVINPKHPKFPPITTNQSHSLEFPLYISTFFFF